MPGGRARSALAAGPATRFHDVRWVPDTGSTNADAMDLVRGGAAEGIVLVADHQTAGRGRRDRVWEAPLDASLLLTVLLRPPAEVVDLCTMAVGLAAAEAVAQVAGFPPRLKWPNDLVWPGDGSGPDRKLAGILAEADWASASAPGVAVGIGINVSWPQELPPELADVAIACNHVTGEAVDRVDLLVALLQRLEHWYSGLVATRDREPLLAAWRTASATLGRNVRVELGREDVEGVAVDVTTDGHLVVDLLDGDRRVVSVGDVTHLHHQ